MTGKNLDRPEQQNTNFATWVRMTISKSLMQQPQSTDSGSRSPATILSQPGMFYISAWYVLLLSLVYKFYISTWYVLSQPGTLIY